MPINKGTKTEQIDPRVLEILGLQDVFDFTYAEYLTLLKGKMAEARMTKSSISTERSELLTKEYKRVKNKEGSFKVKKKKISSVAVGKSLRVTKPLKALPPGKYIGGDGSIVKYVEQQNKTLGYIEKTLKTGVKNEGKRSKEKRRVTAQAEDKRKKVATEKILESGPDFSAFQKLAAPIVKPVEDLFSRILKYLGLTFAGFVLDKAYKWWINPDNKEKVEKIQNFFTSVGKWFGNEDNQKKIGTLVKFLKDHWVALFGIGGLLLLYNNSFFRFGIKLTGILTKSIIRLGLLTGKLLAKAAALGWKGAAAGVGLFGKGLRGGARALKGIRGARAPKAGPIQPVTVRDITARPALGPEIKPIGLLPPAKGPMPMGPESLLDIINPFNRGGMVPVHLTKGEYIVPPKQAQKIGYSNLERINAIGNYNQGGSVETPNNQFNVGGLIPGRGPNVDTVRTSLPAGSFVIQRPSVDKIGAGNLSRLGLNKGGSVKISPQDFRDLAYIVSSEAARGTNDEYGVAGAVLNRVASPVWPNTVRKVGNQPGQFEAVYKGKAKDDPKLAQKLASAQGQGSIASAMRLLNGRTDFKGQSMLSNKGSTDIMFHPRGNFFHYTSQRGKNDPPPKNIDQSWKKLIGSGGASVDLSTTTGPTGFGQGGTGGGGSNGEASGGGNFFQNLISEFSAFEKLSNVLSSFNKGGVVQTSSPDTGSGWTVAGLKDQQGRPAVFSKGGAEAFARMMVDSGGKVKGSDIASSKRSPAKNKAVGGVPNSNHLGGIALDIHGSSQTWMRANAAKYGWMINDYPGSHGGHFDFKGAGANIGSDITPSGGGGGDSGSSGGDFFSLLNPYTKLLSEIETITGTPQAEIKTNIPDKITKVSTTSPSSMKRGGQISAALAPLPSSVLKQGPSAGTQGNTNPKRDSDTSVKTSPPNDASNTFEWGYEKVFGIMGV